MAQDNVHIPADPPKYIAALDKRITDGRFVIVFEEKEERVYYDPRDWGGYFEVCYHVFMKRLKDAYWGYPTVKPTPPKAPDPIPETTDPDIIELGKKRTAAYNRKMREYREDLEVWAYVDAASKGNKWAAAWVIDRRKDHEYEGFDIEPLEMPPKKA
jgi:hypothetical protein